MTVTRHTFEQALEKLNNGDFKAAVIYADGSGELWETHPECSGDVYPFDPSEEPLPIDREALQRFATSLKEELVAGFPNYADIGTAAVIKSKFGMPLTNDDFAVLGTELLLGLADTILGNDNKSSRFQKSFGDMFKVNPAEPATAVA